MRQLSLKILISLLLIPSLLIAETDPSFQQKGYTLTQDSWVFSIEKATEVRNKLIDYKYTLQTNESLQKSLTLSQQVYIIEQDKVKVLLDRNDALSKSLQSSQSMNNVERFAWFALGVIGTSLIVYAVRR